MDSSLSDQFYRIQIRESKISWGIILAVIILAIITVVVMVATVRSSYKSFITDPRIGTSLAYMCAFSHVYPFLAPMFFRNPNTPDTLINIYYYMASFQPGGPSPPWGPGALALSDPFLAIVVPDNWRDAINTIVWYSESNSTAGYSDVMTWASSSGNPPAPPAALLSWPVTSKTPSLLSTAFSYGLPLLNTALMLIGLIAA